MQYIPVIIFQDNCTVCGDKLPDVLGFHNAHDYVTRNVTTYSRVDFHYGTGSVYCCNSCHMEGSDRLYHEYSTAPALIGPVGEINAIMRDHSLGNITSKVSKLILKNN